MEQTGALRHVLTMQTILKVHTNVPASYSEGHTGMKVTFIHTASGCNINPILQN